MCVYENRFINHVQLNDCGQTLLAYLHPYTPSSDIVPLEWSDGKEMTVEEWGSREYNLGFQAGLIHAQKVISEKIMKLAFNQFELGKDIEAKALRQITELVTQWDLKG